MTTMTEIKPAIARSISHNEIVLLEVSAPKAALEMIDADKNVTDIGHSIEENGDLDVYGTRLGSDFRLRIRAAK